jgi:hypothetical protein
MFSVRVADNFHYMDEDETYTHGEFANWSEAVAAAREIVDRHLSQAYQPGMSADALYDEYISFGEDPYIIPVPPGEHFSAWEYAKERCQMLCSTIK